MAESILRLYNSQPVRKAYARRAEFWILDACDYYMRELSRFVKDDFVPTEEDQMFARVRTTGIVETPLEQKLAQRAEGEPETIRYLVVDVGGQRNERKKWVNCFADVKAILFVVNLNAYNQVLFEDNTRNRMQESLALFREITHNPIFATTPIVLFLNKKDLFESMIHEVDLNEVVDPVSQEKIFADYEGGKDVLNALEYIKRLFARQLPEGKAVDVQVVTGVYKRDIKYAFEDVKKALMDLNRKKLDRERAHIKREANTVQSALSGQPVGGCRCGPCGCACAGCACC
jgi:GTPase SAR1 family protein